MAIKVNSNFEFQSKTYGDAKAHFSTISEMAAYNVNLIPNGFITFVDEENANYQWLDINEDDPTTGKWRKFSAADGLVDDTLVTSSTHTYSIDKIKALKKSGDITEDDQKNGEKKVQDLTDKFTKEIDAISDKKQKEIMAI